MASSQRKYRRAHDKAPQHLSQLRQAWIAKALLLGYSWNKLMDESVKLTLFDRRGYLVGAAYYDWACARLALRLEGVPLNVADQTVGASERAAKRAARQERRRQRKLKRARRKLESFGPITGRHTIRTTPRRK